MDGKPRKRRRPVAPVFFLCLGLLLAFAFHLVFTQVLMDAAEKKKADLSLPKTSQNLNPALPGDSDAAPAPDRRSEEGKAAEKGDLCPAVDLRTVYSQEELQELKYRGEMADEGFRTAAEQAALPPRILVVPHHRPAAFLTAQALAWAAENWKDQPPETVILLGPNHENLGSDIMALDCAWQTSAGLLEPAAEILDRLFAAGVARRAGDSFAAEHSMTMLLPVVAEYFPSAKVVPLIFRWRCDQEKLDELWRELESDAGQNALIILSADFSHGLTSRQAGEKDKETKELLESGDWRTIASLDSTSLDCPTLLAWLVRYADGAGYGRFTVLAENDSGQLLGAREQEITSYLILTAGGTKDGI